MNERISKVLTTDTDKKYYEHIKNLIGRENMWLVDNLLYKSYLMGSLDEIKEINEAFKPKGLLTKTNEQ